ncbi:hypothetical protein BDM02DRAFT_3132099 [Thelephora ganbajun]|uniref:Uncharacterized protein n=1 Tax=Thelephora ganbajun TaxID=370292 RepID=A0ACB6Z424_THEGA|nr:hypothetical protein BDM02DRAFT_3132099 [Thelephora ganbajun]
MAATVVSDRQRLGCAFGSSGGERRSKNTVVWGGGRFRDKFCPKFAVENNDGISRRSPLTNSLGLRALVPRRNSSIAAVALILRGTWNAPTIVLAIEDSVKEIVQLVKKLSVKRGIKNRGDSYSLLVNSYQTTLLNTVAGQGIPMDWARRGCVGFLSARRVWDGRWNWAKVISAIASPQRLTLLAFRTLSETMLTGPTAERTGRLRGILEGMPKLSRPGLPFLLGTPTLVICSIWHIDVTVEQGDLSVTGQCIEVGDSRSGGEGGWRFSLLTSCPKRRAELVNGQGFAVNFKGGTRRLGGMIATVVRKASPKRAVFNFCTNWTASK